MNRYYQQGGEMEQLMQLFQAFADTVQDDEFSTAEEVMQMFQELSPEEQQQFVQQAMQIVQQQEAVPELEEEPTMQRGGYVNNTGYLEGYETAKNVNQLLNMYSEKYKINKESLIKDYNSLSKKDKNEILLEIKQKLW